MISVLKINETFYSFYNDTVLIRFKGGQNVKQKDERTNCW